MCKQFLSLISILGLFTTLIILSPLLFDWLTRYTTIRISYTIWGSIVKSTAFVFYVYFGIKFFYRRVYSGDSEPIA